MVWVSSFQYQAMSHLSVTGSFFSGEESLEFCNHQWQMFKAWGVKVQWTSWLVDPRTHNLHWKKIKLKHVETHLDKSAERERFHPNLCEAFPQVPSFEVKSIHSDRYIAASMIHSDFGELGAGCRWSRYCEWVFPEVGPWFWDHWKGGRWSKERPFSKDFNWCAQNLGQVPSVCLLALPFGLHHHVPLLSRPWCCPKGVSLHLRYPTILRGRIGFRKGNTQLQQNTQKCSVALPPLRSKSACFLYIAEWDAWPCCGAHLGSVLRPHVPHQFQFLGMRSRCLRLPSSIPFNIQGRMRQKSIDSIVMIHDDPFILQHCAIHFRATLRARFRETWVALRTAVILRCYGAGSQLAGAPLTHHPLKCSLPESTRWSPAARCKTLRISFATFPLKSRGLVLRGSEQCRQGAFAAGWKSKSRHSTWLILTPHWLTKAWEIREGNLLRSLEHVLEDARCFAMPCLLSTRVKLGSEQYPFGKMLVGDSCGNLFHPFFIHFSSFFHQTYVGLSYLLMAYPNLWSWDALHIASPHVPAWSAMGPESPSTVTEVASVEVRRFVCSAQNGLQCILDSESLTLFSARTSQIRLEKFR